MSGLSRIDDDDGEPQLRIVAPNPHTPVPPRGRTIYTGVDGFDLYPVPAAVDRDGSVRPVAYRHDDVLPLPEWNRGASHQGAQLVQVFAASVAQARGYDVDKPRNLAKSVTVE